MILTSGRRFAGYGFYLLKGKPVFTYNLLALEKFRWEGKDAIGPGKHTIMFDFKYDGPGMAKGGTGVLSVDGKEVSHIITIGEDITEWRQAEDRFAQTEKLAAIGTPEGGGYRVRVQWPAR